MKKKILAIDDDASIRELLEYLLKDKYEIVTKKDGFDAMVWLSDGNLPDLIMTDVDMPKLNGFDFFQNIRSSGFYKDVPIMVFAGLENSKQIITCIQQGADNYLLKPFNPTSLFKKIDRVLNNTDMLSTI